MSQSKKTPFTSPTGIAQYPWLNKPDTQFDAIGQYKVNLRLSKEDAAPLIKTAKKIANDAFGEKANSAKLPFKNDDETGEIMLVTKSKYPPKMIDSTGAVIVGANQPQIFGGSELRVAGAFNAFDKGGNFGVSLQLGAVQIISLSELSNGTGAYSFEPVKDGFVAANDNTPSAEGGDYNF